VETLAHGYGLVEAPRVDAEGNLYFSDVTRGGVYRRAPDGTISTIIPKRRGVGGLVLHADGGLVVTGRDVVHVREGVTRPLLAVDGVVGWNDLTTDAAGRVFVGSLRSGAFETGARVPGECWRIDPGGAATAVYDDVAFANGIGLTPDGRTVLHASYSEGLILAHDLGPDSRGTRRRTFARVPRGHPDGLAVDETGGVWVALGDGGAIARFDPAGTLIATLPVPAAFVTSLCFGGADRRDLYVVTADNSEAPERGGTIFRTRADVPGLVAPLARV
jgi:gluconolactonase